MRIACAIAVVISVKFVILSLACDKKDDLQTVNKPLEQIFADTIDDSIDYISSFFNQDPKPKDNTYLRRTIIPDHRNKLISSIQLQDIPTRNEISRKVNENNNDKSLEVKNNPFSDLISLISDASDSDGGWPSFSWLNLDRTSMRPDDSFNGQIKSNGLPSLNIDTRNHEADLDFKKSLIENNQKNIQQTEPNFESILNEFGGSLRGTEKLDNFFYHMNDIVDEPSVLKEDLVKDKQNRNNALLQQNTAQTVAGDSKYTELPILQSKIGISLADKNSVINKESYIKSASKVDSKITNTPKDANSYEKTKHVVHFSIPKINFKYNSLKGKTITPEISIVDRLFGILNRKDKSPSVTNDFLTKIAKNIPTGKQYFKNIGSHNLDVMKPQSIVTFAPIGNSNENLYKYKPEVTLGDIKKNGDTQNERSDYPIYKITELPSISENFNKWISMKTSESIKKPQYKNNLTVKPIELHDNYASPLLNCLTKKIRNYNKDCDQSPFNVKNSNTIYPLGNLLKPSNGSDNRIILVSKNSEKYSPLEREPDLHGYSKENIRQQLNVNSKKPTTTYQFKDNDRPYSTTKFNDESKSNMFLTVEPTENEFESKIINPENNVGHINFASENGNMHISNSVKVFENNNDDHKVNDNSGKNTKLRENYGKFYFLSPKSNDEATSVNNVENEMVSYKLGVEENPHANTQKQKSDDIFTDLTTPLNYYTTIKIDAKNNNEVTSDRETGDENIKEVTSDNHVVDNLSNNLSELSNKASTPINKGELQNGESYHSTIPNLGTDIGNENISKPLISSVDESNKYKGFPFKPSPQNLEWKSVLELINNLKNQSEINNDNNLKYILHTIRTTINTPLTQRLPARFMNFLLNKPQINQNEITRETTSLPKKYENNIEASLSVQPEIKTSAISTHGKHILDSILETSTIVPVSESDYIAKLNTSSESKYFNKETYGSNANNEEPGKSKTDDFINTTKAKITNSVSLKNPRIDKPSSTLEVISDGNIINRGIKGIDSQRYTESDGNSIILNKPGVVNLNSDTPFQNYLSSNVLPSSGNSEGLVSSPVNLYTTYWNQATPAGLFNMYDYSSYWNEIQSRLYNIEQLLHKYCVHKI